MTLGCALGTLAVFGALGAGTISQILDEFPPLTARPHPPIRLNTIPLS